VLQDKDMSLTGRLFVISGPSGVGKGTLLAKLLKKHPEIRISVSATTRNPRIGEVDGVNYHFVTKEKFQNLVKEDKLLEWAEFAGNYYGTFVDTVKQSLDNGIDIALEIDVKGALQVKAKIPDAILIFILPPSFEELKARLEGRNTETQDAIEKRLSIVESEFSQKDKFDYRIVNDELEKALENIEEIIEKERTK